MMKIFLCASVKLSAAFCGVDYKRTDNKQVVVYLDNDYDERLFTYRNNTIIALINSSEKKWN